MGQFHEVVFPEDISYGATGGPGFSTSVMALSSGAEARNVNWSKQKGRWDVAHAVKTPAQMESLLSFFYARQGKAYAFRFKDWNDWKAPFSGGIAPVQMTTNGATNIFQLVKTYSDGAYTFTRPIYKPIADTVTIYDAALPAAGCSVNATTGIVTLSPTLAATTGHIISAIFQFHVPVRFDTDDLSGSIDSFGTRSWQSIPLVETREI